MTPSDLHTPVALSHNINVSLPHHPYHVVWCFDVTTTAIRYPPTTGMTEQLWPDQQLGLMLLGHNMVVVWLGCSEMRTLASS